jgi:hypothetical protein
MELEMSRSSKRVIIRVFLVASIVIASVLVAILFRIDAITRENLGRIEKGMARSDVERIVGRPTAPDSEIGPDENGQRSIVGSYEGRKNIITVIYDSDDRVISKWITSDGPGESLFDRALRVVGLSD